jgi:NADPH:quinone reductase-like Zn-dependent oxidoreductase
VDHIIEIGGAGTIEKSLKAVRYAGWIHVIGFLAGVSLLSYYRPASLLMLTTWCSLARS